jgi:tRNA dimethylallyltransferase
VEPPVSPIDLVMIVGPTASGKTSLAVRLAEQCDGEIVNADSMQVYRGMDIGTAKPSPEERQRVPHHLLDIVSPEVNFSASDFRREAGRVIADCVRRGKKVFVVGGTGLYLKALTHGLVDSPRGDEAIRTALREEAGRVGNEGLLRRLAECDPATAGRLHPNDQVRIIRALEVYEQTGIPISRFRDEHRFAGRFYNCLTIGIRTDREELYRRIDRRVEQMIAAGLEREVRCLLEAGYSPQLKALRAIGYKEMCAAVNGFLPLEEAIRLIKRDSRHFAKRQLTWFLRDPEINWVEYPDNFGTILSTVIDFFAKGEAHAKSTVQHPGSVS